jgi:hypothetical protein
MDAASRAARSGAGALGGASACAEGVGTGWGSALIGAWIGSGGFVVDSGGVACGAGTDFDGADPVYDQRP